MNDRFLIRAFKKSFLFVSLMIYVIDVSGGDKLPRKGGPGITHSDLLVINKIDLAPHVGASLEVTDRDTKKMGGERPYVFTDMRSPKGVQGGDGFHLEARSHMKLLF